MNLVNTSARLIGARWAPGGSGLVADSHVRVRADALKPKHYDYRIDFFRGLSLIFIFINHIPDNAFSYFTSRTYALFDSAEVFMF
ncbi:MAG: OpgC domain-containing protein, partial [Rhodomicrobium sp.]